MTENLNILLIEDSEDDALMLLRELRRSGFNVIWERVETAEQLRAALTAKSWDIVISDYNLPKLDAPTALEIVKQSQLDLPFIVISGTIGEAAAVELMKQGANDYLMKGNLTRLAEAVRREIREAQIREERRRSTLELDRTKERLQLAIEGSGLGLWDWSVQTGEVTFNDRWVEMIGYTIEELQPIDIETWRQNVHPEDLPKANLALEKHFQKETESYDCELRMRHKLGAWVWVQSKGKVTAWDADGKPLRMIGTHLDISGRKQSVEMMLKLNQSLEERVQRRTDDLQQSENRLREAQKIGHLGIWELDVQTREISWSEEIFRIFRLDPHSPEPSYAEMLTYFPRDDRDRFVNLIDRSIQLGEADATDLQIVRADGSAGHIFVKTEAINDEMRRVHRLFGIAMDISDRKQGELQRQQLFQELSAFKLALDRTAIVATTDAQGIITYVNDYFCEISGYSRDELIGQNHRIVKSSYHPHTFFRDMWRTIASGKIWRGEICNRRKDGSLYWVESSFVPFLDEQGRPFQYLAIRFDITTRKQARAKLHQENTFRQQILETMAEGLCVCSEVEEFPFLHFTVWNQQMQRITGYSLEDVNRLGWDQTLCPTSVPQVQAIDYLEIMRQGDNRIAEELEIQCQDGQKRIISISRSILSNDDGQSYLLALIQDITERKQAELQVQQKTNQERLLASITQKIRSSLNLEEILNTTVEEVHQVLQSDRVLIYRVFPEGTGAAIAESVSPNWSRVLDIVFPEEVFPEVNYDRYVRGRIYVLSDREDPQQNVLPCLIEFLSEIQVRAKVVVPIVQNQTLWGLLIAHQCDRPRQWQSWEIDLLKQIASQVTISIQQAELYSQLQCELQERLFAEEVVRQQAQRELLLREITQRIRQSLDLQTIFETAVQEVRNFLNADRVGIFKFYPESNFDDGEFVAESVVEGFSSAIAIRVHDHTFGDNYASLYAKGRSYVVDDIYNNGAKVCHVDILARFQVKANIVMPLMRGEELWGLLCIHQCGTTRHWKQSEIDFSQQITYQLAIAIQQASLFEQLQQELTERQLAESRLTESNQKLEISNEELIRATRLKDEFLANMSHELRTPLNAILGMTEALQDRVFGTVTDRQIKALQTVERSGTHLLELINDILDVAKIESGQVTLELAATSIENLCQSSMAFIRQQAMQKGIQLINKISANLPDLMLDERRIRQVLINLLNNAVKFTPEGGSITLEVSRSIAEQNAPSYLRIAIIDTGIGISAENIQKLFQPFIQIDSALNRQYVGTGLGLALVKRLVEMHGGKVALTSEIGVGSCFIVEIPYNNSSLSASQSEPNTDTESHQKTSEQIVAPLILLADDNEANVSTVSCYLEAKGYRMILAKDGQEAIAFAKIHHPDLILMDIQMPIVDGIEATKQIRCDANLINIPIIAMTALAMTGDREKCLEAGANEYLAKPVKLKQLVSTIQLLLA